MAETERVIELPESPAPGSVYRAALARTARAMVAPTPGSGRLPGVALRAPIVIDPARADAYRHLLRETAAPQEAPPGLVHVHAFGLQLALMARADFPLPMLGLVHIANRIEQLRPVGVGEALTVTASARHLALRPGREVGTQVEIVTQAATPAGEVVWQGVSTYLAKRTALRDLPMLELDEQPPFEAGLPTGGWSTSAAATDEYARVSGDHNPIHTSGLIARAFGFPGRIAHGMDTAARALAALGPRRPGTFTWTVRFASPVSVPGRVALRVEGRDDLEDAASGTRTGWAMQVWNPKNGKLNLSSALLR